MTGWCPVGIQYTVQSTQGCTQGWYATPRWGAGGNVPFLERNVQSMLHPDSGTLEENHVLVDYGGMAEQFLCGVPSLIPVSLSPVRRFSFSTQKSEASLFSCHL